MFRASILWLYAHWYPMTSFSYELIFFFFFGLWEWELYLVKLKHLLAMQFRFFRDIVLWPFAWIFFFWKLMHSLNSFSGLSSCHLLSCFLLSSSACKHRPHMLAIITVCQRIIVTLILAFKSLWFKDKRFGVLIPCLT